MQTCIAIFLTAVFGWLAAANAPARDDNKGRAETLLAQARVALGGEAKLKAVQSLSASGKLRQVVNGPLSDARASQLIESILPAGAPPSAPESPSAAPSPTH